MVLGLNAKNRRSASVQVDYLIHIQDVKPWPPSQSLRSLRSVLIQWENGERRSGSTNAVVPSIGIVIGEGKIDFNESFRLRVTLLRDMSAKGKDTDTFLKNCLEFNLCEPRRDKTQLLAIAVIDLADYGVINETMSISAPMNCKRSFKNTSEPVLYIKIQPVEKGRTSSSLRDGLSKEVSLEKNGGESVSTLMNEEYAEEAEVASFTDDDVSSHSSLTNGGLSLSNEQNGPDRVAENNGGFNREHDVASKPQIEKHTAQLENLRGSSSYSSVDLSSELGSPVNGHTSILNPIDSSSMLTVSSSVGQTNHSSSSSCTSESKGEETNSSMRSNGHHNMLEQDHGKVGNNTICRGDTHKNGKPSSSNGDDFQVNKENDHKSQTTGKMALEETTSDNDIDNSSLEDMGGKRHQEMDGQNLEERKHSSADESLNSCSQDAARDKGFLGSNALSSSGGTEMKENIFKMDKVKPVKSVRSLSDSVRSNGLISRNQQIDVKEAGTLEDEQNIAGNHRVNEIKSAKIYPRDVRTTISESKIQHLEHRIKMLEGELREAAAVEAALYSVVPEHGSSVSKLHAPARRLSRLYLHACKETSQSRRASAAKSAVSGLVLVAKACGNDVPRLTFWLSNCVVLRAIISQPNGDLKLSARPHAESNGGAKGNKMASSPLLWKQSSPSRKENKSVIYRNFVAWEDHHAFTSVLERVEGWIFSRIVESIWWQTLTPHMQSAATKEIDKFIGSGSKKNVGRTSSSSDQGQGNFSIGLWKEAFKDACERLCPVRAGGHDCGCLPVLARLVMEQCVARLDVAMFNAILRESADEIPTDPVSDPISDLKVLPIPAGKSSFGAGAQLKNAIGNWSRWLTDLFGMDDEDPIEDESDKDENDERQDTSFKSFNLLNALSDLLMLPKDMLLSKSIRKEVCPTFGTPLIKKILDYFVPDEFCPDPIPNVVLQALDYEDNLEDEEDSVTNIPCIAAPPTYLPPAVASVAGIIGEIGSQPHLRRSGSSVLRKSYTSDDELDELNSPLASIILDGSQSSPALTKPSWKWKGKGTQNTIRFELLRDIWLNSE